MIQLPKVFGSSWLVLAARIRSRFLPWLSRRYAENYENQRRGRRWTREERIFRRLYAKVNPRTVLDCPVGTGRWFDIYQQHGAAVCGIDISKEILAQAAQKIMPGAIVVLMAADLLAPQDAGEWGASFDLIVCTRFIHWLRPHELAAFFQNLSGTNSRYLITNAKIGPVSPAKCQSLGLGGFFRNAIRTSRIYTERDLLASISAGGWKLLDRAKAGKSNTWVNMFYLFKRSENAQESDRRQT